MGFFSSLFGGQNKTLDQAIPQAGQASKFATGTGEGLISKSAGWLNNLLSGDPAAATKLLAPQISAAQQQTQQGKQALAQFGTRSGGTAAASAGADAATRGNITNMIASLTGSAIGQGMQAGKGLLDSGIDYLGKQVDFSQQQMENWSNSILGQATAEGVGALMKGATGGAA